MLNTQRQTGGILRGIKVDNKKRQVDIEEDKMKESVFSLEVKKAIEHYWKPAFAVKFPSMYIEGGIPDILCCAFRQFIAIECKLVKTIPRSATSNVLRYGFTKIQEVRAQNIVKAGGKIFGLINLRPLKAIVVIRSWNIKADFNFSMEESIVMEKIQKSPVTKLWNINELRI